MTPDTELPLAETIYEEEESARPTSRDRIVLLGRRAAGKTIYLSMLYEGYWKSLDGISMKAVSGHTHSELMRVAERLRHGVLPPATLEMHHCELEISQGGQTRTMVALDYSGEVFRQAFVEGATERPGPTPPEATTLIHHLDAAAAVLLLVDPCSVCSSDVDAVIDDDFGLTQAVAYLRASPGGTDVPVALVFTKSDETARHVDAEGGVVQFTKKRLPALARTLRKFQIFQVSSVQGARGANGEFVPREDFESWHIEKPLLHCLRHMEAQDHQAREELAAAQRELAAAAIVRRARHRERRFNWVMAAATVSAIIVVTCILVLVWVSQS